jgi:hypothetical protein
LVGSVASWLYPSLVGSHNRRRQRMDICHSCSGGATIVRYAVDTRDMLHFTKLPCDEIMHHCVTNSQKQTVGPVPHSSSSARTSHCRNQPNCRDVVCLTPQAPKRSQLLINRRGARWASDVRAYCHSCYTNGRIHGLHDRAKEQYIVYIMVWVNETLSLLVTRSSHQANTAQRQRPTQLVDAQRTACPIHLGVTSRFWGEMWAVVRGKKHVVIRRRAGLGSDPSARSANAKAVCATDTATVASSD